MEEYGSINEPGRSRQSLSPESPNEGVQLPDPPTVTALDPATCKQGPNDPPIDYRFPPKPPPPPHYPPAPPAEQAPEWEEPPADEPKASSDPDELEDELEQEIEDGDVEPVHKGRSKSHKRRK